MKFAVFAVSAALLGLAGVSPVLAAPSSAAGYAAIQSDGVTLVAQKKYSGKNYGKKKGMHRHGFRPGGRYKKAPGGWHRYDSRPGNWSTRGCIIVGPIWWCP